MKIRIIGVLLCACLLLSACGTHGAGEQTQPPEADAIQTAQVTREAAYDTLPAEESYYQYGNMQKNVPSGNYMLLGNEVVFQVAGEQWVLYAYDLDTGTVRNFCDREACSHSSAGCVGINNVFGNVEQYGGRIYGQSALRSVMELTDGRWRSRAKEIRTFWHSFGDLFVVTEDNALQIYEDGTGEPRTIVEDYDKFWNVAFGRYLYGYSDDTLTRVDLLTANPEPQVILENCLPMIDGEHIYYTDAETFHLYRCNMDGSGSEQILDKPVLIKWGNFDEEYFYFRLYTDLELDGEDSHEIYRFPKDDPSNIELIASLEEVVRDIFTVPGTGKIFVTTRASSPIYVMNTDGSDLRKLELPQPGR